MMKMKARVVVITGVLALTAAPALAQADAPPHGKGKGNGPTYTPGDPTGPKDGSPPKGKAYGHHCKGESKKHVKGEKGTAFSRCVKDVVALRKEEREKEKEASA